MKKSELEKQIKALEREKRELKIMLNTKKAEKTYNAYQIRRIRHDLRSIDSALNDRTTKGFIKNILDRLHIEERLFFKSLIDGDLSRKVEKMDIPIDISDDHFRIFL